MNLYFSFKQNEMKNVILQSLCTFIGLLLFSTNMFAQFECEDPDVVPPVAVCNSQLSYTLESENSSITLHPTDIDEGSFDNCPGPMSLSFSSDIADTARVFTIDDVGIHVVVLWATDASDNQSNCWSEVIIFPPADCENDETPPFVTCVNGLTINLMEGMNSVIWSLDFVMTSMDDCTTNENMQYRIVLGDWDDPANPPLDEFLTFTLDHVGIQNITVAVGDESGNWSFCSTTLFIQGPPVVIQGNIFNDVNGDCINNGETSLSNWKVQLTADGFGESSSFTDAEGNYTITTLAFGTNENTAEISLVSPYNFSQGCPNTYTLSTSDVIDGTITRDFPVKLLKDCPALYTDISTPFLRRCFDNIYTVQYCNYGAQTAENVNVEISFDDDLIINSSTIPHAELSNGMYSFELGSVEPAQCALFYINASVSCDAVLGQTHCVEAHIYPDSLCVMADPSWTGASIQLEGSCNADSVNFIIKNIGDGDMEMPLRYIVIEDVIMLQSNDFQLNADGQMALSFEANGSTFRLEAEQETGHPGSNMPMLSIEGCGTNEMGDVSLGFVNQFEQNDIDPFVSIDCQENIGAYDPNDKAAFPKGVGAENYIKTNTDIEYKIRFQNTGTDTAFKVVVYDTLSPFLNAATVRPGASSHPYTFSLLDENVLRFTFSDIMLPDSNINEAASHGFVKFKLSQISDNPLETRIENQAAIYFDFNEPVLTNTTFHIVGEDFLDVHISGTDNGGILSDNKVLFAEIFPNPVTDQLKGYFRVNYPTKVNMKLVEITGKTLYEQNWNIAASGQRIEFEISEKQMTEGIYFLYFETDREVLTRKIVKVN